MMFLVHFCNAEFASPAEQLMHALRGCAQSRRAGLRQQEVLEPCAASMLRACEEVQAVSVEEMPQQPRTVRFDLESVEVIEFEADDWSPDNHVAVGSSSVGSPSADEWKKKVLDSAFEAVLPWSRTLLEDGSPVDNTLQALFLSIYGAGFGLTSDPPTRVGRAF